MPSEIPGQITLPTRDEIKARYKQSHTSKDTNTDLDDPNLEIDASVIADALLPGYANQRIIGSNAVLEDATGAALVRWGRRVGVGDPLEASGATGLVIVDAGVGGITVTESRELADASTGLKYNAVLGAPTAHFENGDEFVVQAVDTGPRTNVPAGKLLTWSSAPSGAGPTVTVATNTDGSGLTGGRDTETDPEYRLRIRAEQSDRSRDGNDAHYRATAKKTPGVRVGEAFTWPACLNTGTTALAVTLPAVTPGASRVPNEAQRALVEAYVEANMPGDDCKFFPIMNEQQVDIAYQLNWTDAAAGWADMVPWPPYYPPAPIGSPGAVVVDSASDATHFVLKTQNGNYTSVRQPSAGQSLAFYNQTAGAFVLKRISSVSGSGPWTIVSGGTGSDAVYIPSVGRRAMPWSASLARLLYVAPVTLPDGSLGPAGGIQSMFDRLGPGEMTSTPPGAGRRRRRQPQSPREWPNTLTAKGLEDAIEIDEVEERSAVEGPGLTTTVGTPGVVVYLMRLRSVAVFPI
jgi:uncharacterized phage protein gp47/JayE